MLMRAMRIDSAALIYGRLMMARSGDAIEFPLASMLSSMSSGMGSMPDWLGLDDSAFAELMACHFPGFNAESLMIPGVPLDEDRLGERDDLLKLLMGHRTQGNQSEAWLAQIIVAGCQANDHLWQDLGLWQRADLSKLMNDFFEPLARRNDKDMKWKKFLYKQLCNAEGIYVCRAPSCEVCADYDNCFGPED